MLSNSGMFSSCGLCFLSYVCVRVLRHIGDRYSVPILEETTKRKTDTPAKCWQKDQLAKDEALVYTSTGRPQRYCRLVPDHHSEAPMAVEQVMQTFWFPSARELWLHYALFYDVCERSASKSQMP